MHLNEKEKKEKDYNIIYIYCYCENVIVSFFFFFIKSIKIRNNIHSKDVPRSFEKKKATFFNVVRIFFIYLTIDKYTIEQL